MGEIVFKGLGLVDRDGFGESGEEHAVEPGIAEPREKLQDLVGDARRGLAAELAVVGLRRVEQEEGVPGRGGVAEAFIDLDRGHGEYMPSTAYPANGIYRNLSLARW